MDDVLKAYNISGLSGLLRERGPSQNRAAANEEAGGC